MTRRLPLDVDALRARATAGERFAFLCFWGHRPRADGAPSASCFSQWYPSPFTVDGVRYATAEHWMMAGKARLFGDESALAKVLANDDPGAAKAAGRGVRHFDEARWSAHRFDLVVEGNLAKFSQHPDLRRFLLSTGDRVLVEASPVDPIWGIGLAAADPRATEPAQWTGLNLLGFALMVVRERLAAIA
ncbi:NADAR family protein [Lysobacter brunescens]|uniref:NADAR family protein n=1 Tax=Lysobacter brunescens TaxID=262323 RepID=A0ABW2YBJ6_9GAMM